MTKAHNLSTDTLAGRCAKFLLDNSLTVVTEHGVQVVLPVTSATLCELVDLVVNEINKEELCK